MSAIKENKRKRTRSAKGQAYDELLLEGKSPKAPKAKESQKMEKEKPKASRKIIFHSDTEDTEPVNNNAVVKAVVHSRDVVTTKESAPKKRNMKVVKSANNKKSRVIDPCFKNVLNKELEMERRVALASSKNNMVSKGKNNANFKLQDSTTEVRRDGIQLEVDGLEDLDYVDDCSRRRGNQRFGN